MRFREELEKGFFLTMKGENCGMYINSFNKKLYCPTKDNHWYEYKYLRIHLCRMCKKHFILEGKSNYIFLKFPNKNKPSNPLFGRRCKFCKSDDVGLDDPINEHCVYVAPGIKRSFR